MSFRVSLWQDWKLSRIITLFNMWDNCFYIVYKYCYLNLIPFRNTTQVFVSVFRAQHNYLLYDMSELPSSLQDNIQAIRTISFASLRINYDNIPTKALNILITNSLNIVKIHIFSSLVVHIYCVSLWLHANWQPNTWPLQELYAWLLEVNQAHKRMTLTVERELSLIFGSEYETKSKS